MLAALLSLLMAPAHAEFLPGTDGPEVYNVLNSAGAVWGQIVVGNGAEGWEQGQTYWLKVGNDGSCVPWSLPGTGSGFQIQLESSATLACTPSPIPAPQSNAPFLPESGPRDLVPQSGSGGQWYKMMRGGVLVGYAHKKDAQQRLRFALNEAGMSPAYYKDRLIDLSNGDTLVFTPIEPLSAPFMGVTTIDVFE